MKYRLLILINLLWLGAHAQDSVSLPGKLIISGYVKDLQVVNYDKGTAQITSLNLIHNRTNIKWKPLTNTAIIAELRNRLFWGEDVRRTPGFAASLRNPNEDLNMQKAWIADSSFVAHTNVERLYCDYNGKKINIRIGRQRINWGIATTWNPNDIFNTYNFLDFDYEERPGSDGGKVQYRFGNSVNLELAYANTGQKHGGITAAKLVLNKWDYDMQVVWGLFRDHPTIGFGWAGNIKDAGFKGEIQYFLKSPDSADNLNIVFEGDYMFEKGWYLNSSILFNANGLYKPTAAWQTVDLGISPERLMPTRWNITLSSNKEINPLLSGTITVLYAPGTNLIFILPSLQYSLVENLDLSVNWQSFFAEINDQLEGASHRCFLRMKWSF